MPQPNQLPDGDSEPNVGPQAPEFGPAAEVPPFDLAEAPSGTGATSSASPEVLEIFAAEAEEHLLTMGRSLPALELRPDDRAHLAEVRRAVHTLKGAAASVGFAALARLAHRAEDLLDRLYDARRAIAPDQLALLHAAHDALEELAAGRADEASVSGLYARFDAALADAPPAPASGEEPAAGPVAEAADDGPVPSDAEPSTSEAVEAGRAAGQALRVPVARIDEAVKLVGELIVSRAGFEEQLGRFGRLVQEFQLSAERLRRATARLETQYEARALAGGRLPLPPSSPINRLAAHAGSGAYGFDDLEFDRYTDFHLLSRELSETATDIGTIAQEFHGLSGDLDGYLVRQARLTGEVQDKLMRVRTVPLAHLTGRLQRTVRRTAAAVGKSVRLTVEGERTDLDKTVLEEMSEPLLHVLRNAVDHGIESAAERAAAGKPARGEVAVRARAEGTQVAIRVTDDGRGIDLEAVRATAVARGFLAPDEAAAAGPAELHEVLFRPGFSTAAAVGEVSGRGVGLDAVKVLVERLKGTVSVASEPGRGTTFTVRLPLNLAVLRSLLVRAGGQTFALPLGAVARILRLDPEVSSEIEGQDLVRIEGETLPRVGLAERLNLRGGAHPARERPPVVVVSAGDRKYAVVVDEIIGGREVVLKSLGTHVRRAPGIAGATLMGDGSVVLILDPADLFRAPAAAAPRGGRPAPAPRPVGKAVEFTVLVVDDSPSVRRIVSGQLREAGLAATTAKDGRDALDALHRADRLPDVVLLDVEMPRMDGYELLSTLRANPTYRHLPAVMLTSRSGEKHRRKAMELGATAYMVKPFQPAELLRTIRAAAAAATAEAATA